MSLLRRPKLNCSLHGGCLGDRDTATNGAEVVRPDNSLTLSIEPIPRAILLQHSESPQCGGCEGNRPQETKKTIYSSLLTAILAALVFSQRHMGLGAVFFVVLPLPVGFNPTQLCSG